MCDELVVWYTDTVGEINSHFYSFINFFQFVAHCGNEVCAHVPSPTMTVMYKTGKQLYKADEKNDSVHCCLCAYTNFSCESTQFYASDF